MADEYLEYDEERVGEAEEERLEEIQTVVRSLLEEAVDHYEEEIEPEQVQATDYYWAREFGNEVDGRSKVVAPEVRDATLGQMPSLMRILYHRQRVVEFSARPLPDQAPPEALAQAEAEAEMKTRHVNRIITELNDGWTTFYSFLKDGLVRRTGWVKWWWQEDLRPLAATHTGLTQEELVQLAANPEVEVEILAAYEDNTFDATIVQFQDHGYERIAAVPPEEIVYSPGSRSRDEASCIAHTREVPMDELVAMGIDPEFLEGKVSSGREHDGAEDLGSARQLHGISHELGDDENVDPSRRPVRFTEAYTYVDGDDDGVAELRLFECVGDDYEIVNGDGRGEIVDEIPLAVFTPDPEPHTIAGLSNFDLVGTIQEIKSQVERAQLDSLSQAVNNDLEVVQGEVNMKDVLSKEANKVIRVRKPGMLREMKTPFVGSDTLPILSYYDSRKEDATGQSKASRGLEANALQSSTAAAVTGTFTKSQERIELIARIAAETVLKQLYRGLIRLAARHRPEFAGLAWEADDHIKVNLALGQGPPEQQLATLQGIKETQEAYLQQGVPFVSFVHLRNTLDEIVRLSGHQNPEKFFARWTQAEHQQWLQAQAQQPPEPDPNQQLVQVEQQKAEFKALTDQARLELEREKLRLEDDRERDKLARETALRELELEMKHAMEIRDRELQEKVIQDRQAQDRDVDHSTGESE